jgi:hypothetical protein
MVNRFKILSRRVRGYFQDSGNLARGFAKRHPPQALELSRRQMRSILTKHFGDHPTMQPIGDLDQSGAGSP